MMDARAHTHMHAQTQAHTHHFLCCLLPVHEALGNDARCEDLVALPELLEQDAVGEAETTDPDSLEHSVASQLVQD